MAVGLSRTSMNLKQFMVRQEVLQLYRTVLKSIKKIENKEDRSYMKNWARADFRANKNVSDELAIKALISHGQNSLRELEKNLNLSK